MYVLYVTQLLQLVGRLGPVNRLINTSWMAVATPTDRHKATRNRVIEVFGGVLVLSLNFFSVGIGDSCHRTESDLFHLFSLCDLK